MGSSSVLILIKNHCSSCIDEEGLQIAGKLTGMTFSIAIRSICKLFGGIWCEYSRQIYLKYLQIPEATIWICKYKYICKYQIPK